MNIERIAGVCLIGTGALTVGGFLIHPHNYSDDVQFAWLLGHSMIFVGLILNLIGLAWVYSVEHAALGKLGLFGFIAISVGLSHYIGKLYWSGFLYPLVFQANPEFIAEVGLGPGASPIADMVRFVFFSGAFIFAFGFAAFGAALLKSETHPTIPVVLLMSGAVAVGVWPVMPNVLQMLSPVVSAIYAIGLVWIGVSLMRCGDLVKSPAYQD